MKSIAVLAGGRSRRLGHDKAILEIDGISLLDRCLERLSPLTDDLLVVCRPDQVDDLRPLLPPPCRLIPDLLPASCPLAGIHAALSASRSARLFIAACDMPDLQPELIVAMMADGAGDIVIPKPDDGWHPLHAVYDRSCLDPIAGLLAGGPQPVTALFDLVKINVWDTAHMRQYDPELTSLRNLNTAEDVAAYRRRD